MAKKKTPKNKSRTPKKLYIGGQPQTLTTTKDLFDSIVNEGNNLYNIETSAQNNQFLLKANDILFFIQNFYQTLNDQYNTKQQDMINALHIYGEDYTSYFILINATLNSILAQAKELLDFTTNVNAEFQNQSIHIHLINQKFALLTNAKLQTNTINEIFQDSLKTFDSIITTIKNYYPIQQQILQKTTSDIEIQRQSLQDSISMVNRPFPTGFIPQQSTTFIQGCPLGTILEGDVCKYYRDLSNTQLIESVPIQTNLLSSDYVIWFNKINQTGVGNPTIFKKKQIQYLLKLTNEDSSIFNVKYIVSQNNGVPLKDNNGFYKFVSDIQYGWNQDTATLINTPEPANPVSGFNNYYLDYDGTPQPVTVLPNSCPVLRNVETITKYVCSLSSTDSIVNGFQYIQTDLSGNISLDLSNNYIPFYPHYYEYKNNTSKNIFTKLAYNNVDIFTFNLLPNTITLTNNKAIFDLTNLDKFSYNQIQSFYKNKFTEISIPEYFSPFILSSFFNNAGDYFLFQNNGLVPIVFDITKTENEKRVILYPKQIICFVYTSSSPNLSYGFLNLDTNLTLLSSTKNVALVTPQNIYVFVETKPLYDNGKYIMQQTLPLFDSEANIISVPNFDSTKSVYYEYDDIFLANPIQVNIVTPTSQIVNDKTYTSMNYPNSSFSPLNIPYISKYVCPTNYGNIFVFCNEKGIPTIDILGYLIPVPSSIYYFENTYNYYSLDVLMPVEIKSIYFGAGFVNNYDYSSQLQTYYSSICQNIQIYTDKKANPILYDNKTFIISSPSPSPSPSPSLSLSSVISATNINVNLPIGFKMLQVDIQKKEFEMKNLQETNRNKIYIQNTNLLIDHFKDLSGSMNNLQQLSIELNSNIQQMVLANNIDTLKQYDTQVDTIYNEILDTYKKLQDYVTTQKSAQVITDQINEYKTIRNNELTIIKGSLLSLSSQINNLRSVDDTSSSDLKLLNNTLEKLKTSFNILNVNIDSSNDLLFLQNQEKSTQLLLKGIQTLQNNVNSYKATIQQKQNNISAQDLEDKQKDLQSLSSKILQIPIDTYNSQLNALPLDSSIDSLKQNIKISINNIQTIVNEVQNEPRIVYTNDTINTQINKYQTYINSINLEKQNIQNYLQEAQDTLSQKDSHQLVSLKSTLQENLQYYQKNVILVNNLLNTMSLTLDQKTNYQSQINNNNLEIQTINNNIGNINNVAQAQAYIDRVNEIINLNNTILTQLQTLELNPIKQSGGKKRRSIKSLLITK
jgi:hypothetical protein